MKILFYLRRVENDLDMELQRELLEYMQAQGISTFVVQYILNSSLYMNADLVKVKIGNLFS